MCNLKSSLYSYPLAKKNQQLSWELLSHLCSNDTENCYGICPHALSLKGIVTLQFSAHATAIL